MLLLFASALISSPLDCQYATGDEFAKQFGWSFENRGRDLGFFLCYVIVSRSILAKLIVSLVPVVDHPVDLPTLMHFLSSHTHTVQHRSHGSRCPLPHSPLLEAIDTLAPKFIKLCRWLYIITHSDFLLYTSHIYHTGSSSYRDKMRASCHVSSEGAQRRAPVSSL